MVCCVESKECDSGGMLVSGIVLLDGVPQITSGKERGVCVDV